MNFDHILQLLKPPPRRGCNDWAIERGVLVGEGGVATRWKPVPYQIDMLNAMTPGQDFASGAPIWYVAIKKSARVGYTKCLGHVVGRNIDETPSRILVVQPTKADCEIWAKEELHPMVEATPCLTEEVSTEVTNSGKSSLLHKTGGGWVLSVANAMTPRSFRAITRDLVLLDESDAYPKSTGKEGDPVRLAIKRTETSLNRMIIEGSTPIEVKTSRITKSYERSDKRRFFVPCPKCNHKQYLKWKQFTWKKGCPASIVYLCEKCGHAITSKHQRAMVEAGEWRPTAEGRPGVAGFHIWTAYSYAPNATWQHLAEEYDEVKDDPTDLQTFVNTALGEAWAREDDVDLTAGDIMSHLEKWESGICPAEVSFLTAGIDTQGGGGSDKERLEISVWGWGANAACWHIFHGSIDGDPQKPEVWKRMAQLVKEPWPRQADNGKPLPPLRIKLVCVDSGGHSTQAVYSECRQRPGWEAVKGAASIDADEVTNRSIKVVRKGGAQRFKHQQFYSVGTNKIKDIIFTRLIKLTQQHDQTADPLIHFPHDLSASVAEQLVSEHRVETGSQGKLRWMSKSQAPSEAWDCLVYAWAAMRILTGGYDPRSVWDQLRADGMPKKTPPKKPKGPQKSYQAGRSYVDSGW